MDAKVDVYFYFSPPLPRNTLTGFAPEPSEFGEHAGSAAEASSGAVSSPFRSADASTELEDGEEVDEDPTSLKVVLAALSKTQTGKNLSFNDTQNSAKGVKRGLNISTDEAAESKRPCGASADSESEEEEEQGREKRALDTSGVSQQVSPQAKVPRTVANGKDESVEEEGNAAVEDNNSNKRPHSSLSDESTLDEGGFVGLGGEGGGGGERGGGGMPSKKKRCVNPWEASLSSSRKMLTQPKIVSRVFFFY